MAVPRWMNPDLLKMGIETPTPTVMVIGKSGTGKSTLCNYLLYNRPRFREGFKASGGVERITEKCEEQTVPSTPCPNDDTAPAGGRLRAIDTPGIPDPSGRTLDIYNDIVRTLHRVKGLNALILNVCDVRDRLQVQQDFDTYGTLLQQFENISCMKILVCRVRLQDDLTPYEKDEDMAKVEEWVDHLKRAARIPSAIVVYIYENNPQAPQFFALRQLITHLPFTPIGAEEIETYYDLEQRVARLTEVTTRNEALERKSEALEHEKERLRKREAKLTKMVVGAWASVLAIPYAAYLVKEKERNRDRQAAIDTERRQILGEVASKTPDHVAFQRDKDTLNNLREIARINEQRRREGVPSCPPYEHANR